MCSIVFLVLLHMESTSLLTVSDTTFTYATSITRYVGGFIHYTAVPLQHGMCGIGSLIMLPMESTAQLMILEVLCTFVTSIARCTGGCRYCVAVREKHTMSGADLCNIEHASSFGAASDLTYM